MRKLKAFMRDTSGATAIEYAMVATGISILIIAGARQIGQNVTGLYINKISANLT